MLLARTLQRSSTDICTILVKKKRTKLGAKGQLWRHSKILQGAVRGSRQVLTGLHTTPPAGPSS